MTSESSASNEMIALDSLDDELVKDRATSENEQEDASDSVSEADDEQEEFVADREDRKPIFWIDRITRLRWPRTDPVGPLITLFPSSLSIVMMSN